jgi:hypothetical protein
VRSQKPDARILLGSRGQLLFDGANSRADLLEKCARVFSLQRIGLVECPCGRLLLSRFAPQMRPESQRMISEPGLAPCCGAWFVVQRSAADKGEALLTAGRAVRLSHRRPRVRDRYVMQVLGVTLGFGVLLGLIAVVDTPRDWSQEPTVGTTPVPQDGHSLPTQAGNSTPLQIPAAGGSRPSERMSTRVAPRQAMSPRVVDFADKSDSPSDDSTDNPYTLPWHNCDHAGAAHQKACEDADPARKTGKMHHC